MEWAGVEEKLQRLVLKEWVQAGPFSTQIMRIFTEFILLFSFGNISIFFISGSPHFSAVAGILRKYRFYLALLLQNILIRYDCKGL